MTTVDQITGAVRRLPKRELARFRKWFAEYHAAVWDRRFAQDGAAGRLEDVRLLLAAGDGPP
jgi:DNA repair photolyase